MNNESQNNSNNNDIPRHSQNSTENCTFEMERSSTIENREIQLYSGTFDNSIIQITNLDELAEIEAYHLPTELYKKI